MTVELCVLGAIEARIDGRAARLGHARQRCVLAVLAVAAGQPVPVDQLVTRVWADQPPGDGRNVLYTYIARLRHALAGGATIERRPEGYLLAVDPMAVDLHRFRHLLDRAHAAGDDQKASSLFATAIGLWRGDPFAGIDNPWLAGVRESLTRQRWEAELAHADACLRLGQHARLLPELVDRAAAHPLDERAAAQLMLALYRAGRAADALRHYRDVRQRLIDELGVEPGARLRHLHQRLLTADTALTVDTVLAAGTSSAPTVVPRQLPTAPPHFTGRARELAVLTDLLARHGTSGGAVVISAIGGTAGIGKTALALYWAHRVAERFPDGQLYVNLRGFDPTGTPLPAATVIRRFLDALALPRDRIPAEPDGQADLYRSLMSGRRMLLVIDNALDGDQVRPLLPGTSDCLVLVTSRNQLTQLVALDGAILLTLDLLAMEEARELLARRLGIDRVTRERRAADELIELCARLPLALNIVAARALTRPRAPLDTLATEMRDLRRRLDLLTAGGDAADVRVVFSWSYRMLSPAAARLFRLLGLHPGPDITSAAAASLGAAAVEATTDLLAELTGAHLVAEDGGRYGMHDLLRAYAAELAEAEEDVASRRAAIRRGLDHYLVGAADAQRLLEDGGILPIDMPPTAPGVVAERFTGDAAALDWYTAEYRVLLNMTELAAATGFDVHAWQLPRAMRTFFDQRALWPDWDHTHGAAAAAAARLRDSRAEAMMLLSWSRCLVYQGRLRVAEERLEQALELFGAADDRAGQVRVLVNLGVAASQGRDYRRAVSWAQRAYDLYVELGELGGQAGSLANIGLYRADIVLNPDDEAPAGIVVARATAPPAGNRS